MASAVERCRTPVRLLAAVALLAGAAACGGGGGGDGGGEASATTGGGGQAGETGTLSVTGPGGEVVRVQVPGDANIFGSGHGEPPAPAGGGAGTMPIEVPVSANETVEFPTVTGTVRWKDDVPEHGPDGQPGPTDINGVGGIAGLLDRDTRMALVGVFLGPEEPAGEPTRLDFSGNHDFETLAPLPGQVFFIGDGRTAAGVRHRYEVPDTATRLFLGLADAYELAGDPGYYGDDIGAFDVEVRPLGATDGLVLNGGYETFVVDASSVERCDGASGITGWDVAGGCVEQVTTGAHGGRQAVVLGTEQPGTLSTTVATEPGRTHVLSFWLAALGTGEATGTLTVSGFEPAALGASPGDGDAGWSYREVTFVAAGEATELAFTGDAQLAIDDVGLAPL